jgi:penicillin-binding protein 1C
MDAISWFILPPVQEWYYRKNHPTYQSLPPWDENCPQETGLETLEFIYPLASTKVFVPVGMDNEAQEVVLEVSSRYPDQKVYWHLDKTFLGETESNHQFAVIPEKGWHTVTVVNESGESNSVRFEVVGE